MVTRKEIEKKEYEDESWVFTGKGQWANTSGRLPQNERIKISIVGHPDDFTITLEADAELDLKTQVAGRLSSLLGGGFLFVRKLKTQEAFLRWREQFWKYLNVQIADLSNE